MDIAVAFDRPIPQQSRSLKTQQSFLEAGWDILRDQSWDSISISELASRAGRSIGAFYQRFGSKDDFLTVLLNRWLETSFTSMEHWPPVRTSSELIDWFLGDAFERIRSHRYLWCAALQRALDDPKNWEPFRTTGASRRDMLATRLGQLRGYPLSEGERQRLGLAVQVFNSVINNALLHDPGPLRVDQSDFLPTLTQMFNTIAALDGEI